MSFAPQLNEKEQRSLAKWKLTRQRKWRWMIKIALRWGGPTGLLSYLFKIRFDTNRFDGVAFAVYLAVFMIGGLLLAYWLFKAQDQRFQQVYQDVSDEQ